MVNISVCTSARLETPVAWDVPGNESVDMIDGNKTIIIVILL
jgi:hypothetical protein